MGNSNSMTQRASQNAKSNIRQQNAAQAKQVEPQEIFDWDGCKLNNAVEEEN
jgi:hypothetical protein